MRFRFRTYDEEKDRYHFIASIDVKDYNIMYKTLLYMSNGGFDYNIELNTENEVDTIGVDYNVKSVQLCVSNHLGKEALQPHFVVDVEELN